MVFSSCRLTFAKFKQLFEAGILITGMPAGKRFFECLITDFSLRQS
jgi:hypothetical protein